MIFAAEGHIEMIRNGLHPPTPQHGYPSFPLKTQTRRMKRSYYQIEAERKNPHEVGYAVQRKRGAKGEPDIRIVMDVIWKETVPISKADALAEGWYTQEQYEKIFRELNPKWDGQKRWTFKFHVIEVRND